MRPKLPSLREPEEYRGAVLRPVFADKTRQVVVSMPGAVFDGHGMVDTRARELVDWQVDTGGDMARWPHPWEVITRPRGAQAPALPPAPPPARAAEPIVPTVAVKAQRGRKQTVRYEVDPATGKLRF